jgi:hypothetical protein
VQIVEKCPKANRLFTANTDVNVNEAVFTFLSTKLWKSAQQIDYKRSKKYGLVDKAGN